LLNKTPCINNFGLGFYLVKKKINRECQPCTACCDGWVKMDIKGVPVYPGSACPHSTKQGCDDYDNRPVNPCDYFNCGWIMKESPLPDWMKPNNSKVMIIFDKLQWLGMSVDLAVPVGKRIPPRSLNWLKQFSEQYNRPLLYMEHEKKKGIYQPKPLIFAYGPPTFQDQMSQWQAQGKTFW
jgi:hypothetical protein